MDNIDWTKYDAKNPTEKQYKQILIWRQEAEFRNLMFKTYGMALDSKYVESMNDTPEGIAKQDVFFETAMQIQDSEDIKQALIMGNYTVAATLLLPYDDGQLLVKCMSKATQLANMAKPKPVSTK